jgi:MoaA/NifB/PqqE/SkfB family radical SAM enzyme
MQNIDKILRGTPLHLSKSGRLSGFTYLMINLPFVCNYRCPKCFNLEGGNFRVLSKPISIERNLQLIKEAKRLNGKVVVLAGEGEPILDKIFKKIIKKINSLGMIPIVYTNGSTLNKNIIEFLAKNNATLVISFDSLSRELYTKLTGINNQKIYQQVLKNIEQARNIFDKYAEYKKGYKIVRIALNMTVNSLNKSEVKKIKNFCADDIYFICNPLARLGNATSNWKKLIKSKFDYKQIQKLVKKYSETTGPLTLGRDGLCGYSINGVAVSPSGEYMTCAYTSLTNGLFNSVFNKSLSEIYNYKRKQEQKYYKTYGKCSCLVRSSKFRNYLKSLKASPLIS